MISGSRITWTDIATLIQKPNKILPNSINLAKIKERMHDQYCKEKIINNKGLS